MCKMMMLVKIGSERSILRNTTLLPEQARGGNPTLGVARNTVLWTTVTKENKFVSNTDTTITILVVGVARVDGSTNGNKRADVQFVRSRLLPLSL